LAAAALNVQSREIAYRTLLRTPPIGPDGLVLDLEGARVDDGRTYLSLQARNKDIPLFLRILWESREVLVARCVGGAWLDRTTRPVPLDEGGTSVSLGIRPDGTVGISLGGRPVLDWPLDVDLDDIASLCALGAWTLDQSRLTHLTVPDEVLRELPARDPSAGGYQPDLVFDVGMHNGDDTEFYLKKGFRVVAIEANPTLCAVAARRFEDALHSARLVICNLGVARVAGELPFYVNLDYSEWSSFDRAVASRGHPVRELTVATAPAEDLFGAFGVPYYCKVDIEDSDHLMIDAIARIEPRPPYVSYENGGIRDFEVLVRSGYDAFQLVEQSRVEGVVLPEPSAEGRTVAHTFHAGSSGPFGRDLLHGWMTAAETRASLVAHHRAGATRAEGGREWWDLHARHRDAHPELAGATAR